MVMWMFSCKRQLTTEPSPQCDELPGDLQSLSWLTTVDVPRLQQMATGRQAFHNTADQQSKMNTALGHETMVYPPSNMQNSYFGINYHNSHPGSDVPASGYPGRDFAALGYTGSDVPASGYAGSDVPASGYAGSDVPASGYAGRDGPASGYAGRGVLSQGYQPPPAFSFPSPQQAYSLAPAVQQHSPCSPYHSPIHHSQSLYEQQATVISSTNPHNDQDLLEHPKAFPKPIYSYSWLIAMSLKNSRTGSLPVSEIYRYMTDHFPYFKTAPDGWKNSVRHNLSLNKCFVKVENKEGGPNSSARKGCLWALNPGRIDKMEVEMHKRKRKDSSMSNQDELDRLITDRPAGCWEKTCDPRIRCFPSSTCFHSQSGHRSQAQDPACQGDPSSPHLARASPLHDARLPMQEPYRAQHALYSFSPDVNAEDDALETIVEFAGNLWEEMREEGFSLENMGASSHSPDCELSGPGIEVQPLVDLQVSGLYTILDTTSAGPSHYVPSRQVVGQVITLL